jgi:hypothetical protein
VDQFLDNANERLSNRPHTIAEIGSAKREWKEIDDKKDLLKVHVCMFMHVFIFMNVRIYIYMYIYMCIYICIYIYIYIGKKLMIRKIF